MRKYLLSLLIIFFWMGSCVMVWAEVPRAKFIVSGFTVEGDNPLSQKETQKILLPFLGEHEGLEQIENASSALQEAFYRKGYTFHRVILPPQKATEGIIKLKVITFQLKNIQVEGNQFYSEENILASLPFLKEGWTPNTRRIARSLLVANEHPSKKIAVFIKESETPGSIDARIETRDSKPHQVFTSLSNTGNDETGDSRVSIGYQGSNLFDKDHVLTLSYTTSPGHFSDIQQYGGHYRIPLYDLGARINLFYTHSKADQGTIADFFQVSGKGTFSGISMDYALYPLADYNHNLTIGIQDKLFENDTRFNNIPIGVDIRSRPLSIRYTGHLEKPKYKGGIFMEVAGNLGRGADNTPEAYAASRAGANRYWDVLRYGANLDYSLPEDVLFRARFTGQFADEPLISGEQLGLGGAQSVRGFEEREVSGDGGYQLNLEVWSPPIRPGVRLLTFMDRGKRYLDMPLPGMEKKDILASVGLGLRWQWKDKLSFSIDAAHVTDGSTSSDTKSDDDRIHFNLFYRF